MLWEDFDRNAIETELEFMEEVFARLVSFVGLIFAIWFSDNR